MTVIVRGYGDGKLVFEGRIEPTEKLDGPGLYKFALSQAHKLNGFDRHLIEFEFPDEPPDSNERFYRIGMDAAGNIRPVPMGDGHVAPPISVGRVRKMDVNITQIARKLGITKAELGGILAGDVQPPLSLARSLADELGVSVKDVIALYRDKAN